MTSTNIPIIYEDEDIMALHKPANLVAHSDGRTDEPSVYDWIVKKYPAQKDVGGVHTLTDGRTVPRGGMVHRIDRETSGVLVVAKNDKAFEFLQSQFIVRSVEKTYDAIVWGVPNPPQGEITLPIGRSRKDFRNWAVPPDARGTLRQSSTPYKVLFQGSAHAHVEVSPKTGRTHQIRVHFSAIGNPIVCDKRYGSPNDNTVCALGFTRHALHARTLTITLVNGVRKSITAPLPDDFIEALKIISALNA